MDNQTVGLLSQPAPIVAQRLIGCHLVRSIDGQTISLKIVETEAYDQTDAASHSYHGRTPRTDVMFGPAGHLYVYFTYGMHYCCNVVTGQPGEGSAVLLRALEPLGDAEPLRQFRLRSGPDLTNGPAKLCQALGINKSWNGHDLSCPPLQLVIQPAVPAESIVRTNRIGISKATDRLWRFYMHGSAYVSRSH